MDAPWVSVLTNRHADNEPYRPAGLAGGERCFGTGAPIRLLGPGDITSMEASAVIRTDPRDGATAFEPNYLAMAELALPDLPWLFSPVAPDGNGNRLRPWICLVVVPDTDGVALETRAEGPAILRLSPPLDLRSELPDLSHCDAWAHAQATGDSLSGQALNETLDSAPGISLARLLAPRRLAPDTHYVACIVPTWRVGVHAGLRLPIDDNDLAPAWDATTTAPFALPAYYSFRFRTGSGGDFASLARRIRPSAAPLEAGKRMVDAGTPGFGAAAVPGVRLGFEGALRTLNSEPTPWPPELRCRTRLICVCRWHPFPRRRPSSRHPLTAVHKRG